MLIPRFVVEIFLVGLIAVGASVVSGQDYPNKPIRILVSEPGGNNDFAARRMAQGLTVNLKQNVIVENRPGNFAPEAVSKASPDGYTLLVAGGSVVIGPLIQEAPYDVVKDFLPVTLAVTSPNILVVHPSSPIKSVKDLIDIAKARPGELNYSSAQLGSSNHLSAELFKSMANVNIVRVPYKGAGPALSALVAGQVDVSFGSAGSAMPHIKSGRLRALAVTSAQPTSLAPGLPTVASAGLPGYESLALVGMFAPAKTPTAIINRLNQESILVLNRADVKEQFLNSGVETIGSSPDQFAARIKSEIAKTGKLIKDAGIKAD